MRRPLFRDTKGAITPLIGVAAVSLVGFGALAIDAGRLQFERRRLQAATDAAALSAARAPANAVALATTAMSANGLGNATLQVTAGQYADVPATAVAQRFVAAVTGSQNAVQVVGSRDVPLTVSQLLLGQPTARVRTTSVAAHNPAAVFTIGTGTASLNSGLANQLLSSLLGGNVSLSAVTYETFANASIGLFSFADELAMQAAVTGWTYRDFATSTVRVGQVLDAAANVLASRAPQAASALNVLSQAAYSQRHFSAGQLVDFSLHQARGVGTFGADDSYLKLSSNLFDFIAAAAAMGGPDSALTLTQGITLPGLADVSTQFRLLQPPQTSGVAAAGMGVVGARAQTNQARLLLNARLLTLIGGGVVNLPIFVEVAPAQGELRSITCQGSPGTDTSVQVHASTGLARVQIGSITNIQFLNVASSPGTLPPAEILRVNLNVLGLNIPVRVLVSASNSIASGSGTLSFSAAEITAGTIKTVSSGHLAGTLASSLGNSLTISTVVDLSAVSPLLSSAVNAALQPLLTSLLTSVRGLLVPVLNALDEPLNQLLSPLGLRLGYADIRVGGFQCGLARLVR
jgi:uncharacterized membrane protein